MTDDLMFGQIFQVFNFCLLAFDLSRFDAAPNICLGHLSFESDRAFPAVCRQPVMQFEKVRRMRGRGDPYLVHERRFPHEFCTCTMVEKSVKFFQAL